MFILREYGLKKLQKILVFLIILISIVIGFLRVLCFFYPNDYVLSVKKYAKIYDIPDDLVFSVIKAESNFDKNARSNKGAMGLMQIMEKTGDWAAEKIGIENFSPDMLYEPEVNIEIGCFYLSYLLDLYNNDTKCALAAYNAGPANVDKWLMDKNYSKNQKTLKKIPFSETENYIEKVMKNREIYDFLY